MGLRDLLRPDPKCSRCGRSYPKGSSCRVCSNVERGHRKQAARRGINPAPRSHQCPDGKVRTMRGGVCPGPYC